MTDSSATRLRKRTNQEIPTAEVEEDKRKRRRRQVSSELSHMYHDVMSKVSANAHMAGQAFLQTGKNMANRGANAVPNLTLHLSNMANLGSHLPNMSQLQQHMPDLGHWYPGEGQTLKPKIHGAIVIMESKNGKVTMDPNPLSTSLNSPVAREALSLHRSRHKSLSPGVWDDGRRKSFGPVLGEVAEAARAEIRQKVLEIMGEEDDTDSTTTLNEDEEVPRPWRLYNFDEIPDWLQDNPYIKTGYQAYTNYRQSWRGIFRWHNETMNIWTHGVGLLIFLSLAFHSIYHLHPQATTGDRVMFMVYSLMASKCMLWSTLFHTHFHVSKEAYAMWCGLDNTGISAMVFGSASILCYFFFYCETQWAWFWITCLVGVNMVGVVGPMFEVWITPAWRNIRAMAYFGASCLSFAPVAHYLLKHGIPEPPPGSAHWWVVGMALSYCLGAVFYIFQIPERWLPGSFDYLGASHQIWHVFVFTAAACLWRGAWELFMWRIGVGHCGVCP